MVVHAAAVAQWQSLITSKFFYFQREATCSEHHFLSFSLDEQWSTMGGDNGRGGHIYTPVMDCAHATIRM